MERTGEGTNVKEAKKRAREIKCEVVSLVKKDSNVNQASPKPVNQQSKRRKQTAAMPSLYNCYFGVDTITRSPETLRTLQNIEKRGRRRAPLPKSYCTFYDNTSPAYRWLLPGWLVEQRIMDHGRIYKYYYDPSGRLYTTKEEVLYAWEQSGLIALDY